MKSPRSPDEDAAIFDNLVPAYIATPSGVFKAGTRDRFYRAPPPKRRALQTRREREILEFRNRELAASYEKRTGHVLRGSDNAVMSWEAVFGRSTIALYAAAVGQRIYDWNEHVERLLLP